ATQTVTLTINNLVENNTANGTSGNDTINKTGSPDHWTIDGLGGDDTITGGTGNDTIRGGAGNDTINLTQGGKDTVVFEPTSSDNGRDTISGFTAGAGGDVLSFSHLTGG